MPLWLDIARYRECEREASPSAVTKMEPLGIDDKAGSDEHNGVPRLIFCTANDLASEKSRFRDLDIDQNFLRLARHHARRDSNGLFGCRTVQEKESEPLKHDSWCCFKIKQVQRDEHEENSKRDIHYEWQQPSINISWNSNDHVTRIICMDAPHELENAIQEAMRCGSVDGCDPYEWYYFVVDRIADLYDESVWVLRDFVRLDVEKRRSPESISFERLHEMARHIIHSNETLEVALSTLEGMQEAHQLFSDEMTTNSGRHASFAARPTQLKISALSRTMKATFLRSKSLGDRINNEINLAYNLVNQRDSSLMKTIAIMTLVYLPGSYLASIFGMNFFDFSVSDGLVLSDMFWLYWVLTVAMTLITVGTWMVWQSQIKHARKPNPEHDNQQRQPSSFWALFGCIRVRRLTKPGLRDGSLA